MFGVGGQPREVMIRVPEALNLSGVIPGLLLRGVGRRWVMLFAAPANSHSSAWASWAQTCR